MNERRTGYVGETNKLKRNGFGVYQYKNNFFRYEGEWKDSKKHGHGRLVMNDGSYYQGEFRNGEISGRGERFWSHNGTHYVGEFENGELDGQGVLTYSDGSSYEGDFCNNMRHGTGTLITKEGKYVGEFYKQKQHGEGEMIFSNGDIYRGYWVMNKRQGHGTLLFSDGSQYEGQFNNDLFNGEGEFRSSSGWVYSGIWVNGSPSVSAAQLEVSCEESDQILQGQEFNIIAQVLDESGEVLEKESGRTLQITAGFRHYPPPPNTALFDLIEDLEETPQETPYGYSILWFPLTPHKGLSRGDQFQSHTTECIPITSKIDEEIENDVSPEDPADEEKDTIAVKEDEKDENAPRELSAEPLSETTSEEMPTERTESPLPPPVPNVTTQNGICKFTCLTLPKAPEMYRPYCVLDEMEGKPKPQRQSGRNRDSPSKVQRKEDIKRIGNPNSARPGEYVIIVEDVTEPPFMGERLEKAFTKIRVHAAPDSPTTLTTTKKQEKRRSKRVNIVEPNEE